MSLTNEQTNKAQPQSEGLKVFFVKRMPILLLLVVVGHHCEGRSGRK